MGLLATQKEIHSREDECQYSVDEHKELRIGKFFQLITTGVFSIKKEKVEKIFIIWNEYSVYVVMIFS